MRTCIILFIISCLILLPTTFGSSQEGWGENLTIEGKIPPIKIGEDTEINLTYIDFGGLNWSYLLNISIFGTERKFFFIPSMAFALQVSPLYRVFYKQLWYGFCHHTVEFYAYVKGPDGKNLSGWYAVVKPSKIEGTTQGHKAKLKLIVRVDGATTYPKAIVVIKSVRRGKEGRILAETYHNISVKAEHIYLLDVRPRKPIIEAMPDSIVTAPVTITNRGNYIETFRVMAEDEEGNVLFNQAFTLNPNERINIDIDIPTHFSLFDIGTPKSIKIKVFPIGREDVVFAGGISVITRGVSLAAIPIFVLVGILIFLIAKLLIAIARMPRAEKKEKREVETGEEKQEKPEQKIEQRLSKKSDLEIKMLKIIEEQEKQKRKLNIQS